MATTVAGLVNHFESDGRAINVSLMAAVVKGAVMYAEGWLGIAGGDGASGDSVACIVDEREYQFKVPASLTVTKGLTVYITVATTTGHYPDDEAYTTAAGAGKIAFFKATADKDGNNIVTGVMIAKASLLS